MPRIMTFGPFPIDAREHDDDDSDALDSMPVIEAQQDTLMRILRCRAKTIADQASRPFGFGERVRYIENAGDMKPGVRDQVVTLYWRRLDLTSELDQELLRRARDHIGGLPSVDCLTANLTQNNQLIFSIASSELLERWQEEEEA